MKRFLQPGVLALAVVMCFISPLSAASGETVIFRENFNSCTAGVLPRRGNFSGGSYHTQGAAHSWSITNEQCASKPYALKVLRDGSSGQIGIAPDKKILPVVNYSVEFKAYLLPENGTVVFFQGKNGETFGGALIQASFQPQGYTNVRLWESSGKAFPVLPAEKWVKFRYDFNCVESYYTTTVTYPDGKVVKGDVRHPFLEEGPLTEIRFNNILPQKNYTYIDDVVISYSNIPNLGNRIDFALRAASGNRAFAALLHRKQAMRVNAGKLTADFSPMITIDSLLLVPARGARLPEKITLRGHDGAGYWHDLLKDAVIDRTTGFVQFAKLENVDQLEISFSGADNAVLSGLCVLSPAQAPQGKLDKNFAEKVETEFKLPVYDRQYPGCDTAELTFINKGDSPLKVEIRLHERRQDKAYGTRIETIPVGRSVVSYDLDQLEKGEYLTYITDVTENSTSKGGKMLRLLRYWNSSDLEISPRPDVTGNRIFFPDGFYLAKAENVDFSTTQAKMIRVTGSSPEDDESFNYVGNDLGLTADGKLGVSYYTINRLWQTGSRVWNLATADLDNLSSWSITPGRFQLDNRSRNSLAYTFPEAAKPDWEPKKGPDGKIKYRFYDPETDGQVKLNQVKLKYITVAAEGYHGYEEYDWGIVTPKKTQVWPIWYKAPGEAVILSKKPLISGMPAIGLPEPPDSGSDLEFGQYLSDDGKELIYGRGRHLHRNNPFIAEYDNISDRVRIIGIWRTRDGLNWDFNYVAPPDNSKPIADQSYGGNYFPVPRANGLRLALLSRYSAYYQQVSWEIIYSWDGFRWTRFQDKPEFAGNGNPGDWMHGGGGVQMDKTITINGKNYTLMTTVGNNYHFEAEISQGLFASLKHIDGEYMRKRMEPRKLAKWPYFKKYFNEDWDKLAEHTRNSAMSIGLLEYRQDGFFYLTGKDGKTAVFETVPLTSKNSKMTANIEIEADGFAKFTILDENGAVFAEKTIEGAFDAIESIITDALPEGKFTVRAELKNARLYTLGF